jgi:hypothetical protein
MTKKLTGLAVLTSVLLIACAAAPVKTWYRADTTEQQFSKDKAACRFEAVKSANQVNPGFRSSFGQELDLANRQAEIYGLCMEAKGYSGRRQEKN